MKKPDPLVVALNSKMFEHGISISDACIRAAPAVNRSTWSRWAAGGAPDIPTFRRLEAAVDELIAEKMPDQPPGPPAALSPAGEHA
jgi:hypothetical protein